MLTGFFQGQCSTAEGRFQGYDYITIEDIPALVADLLIARARLAAAREALGVALSNAPDLRAWDERALPSDHWRALKRAQATYDQLCEVLHADRAK